MCPHVFTGLCRGSTERELVPSAVPFALTAPCHIPIFLLGKSQRRIKEDGKYRGYFPDRRNHWLVCRHGCNIKAQWQKSRFTWALIKSMCRERHMLPAVDQMLARLSEAKVFSKLDATAGFWQLPINCIHHLIWKVLLLQSSIHHIVHIRRLPKDKLSGHVRFAQ